MTDAAPQDELKNVGYELFILLLSILSICNLVIVVLGPTSPRDVALVVDAILVPVFIGDFLYRLLTATSRRDWFLRRFGWADMIAIAPMLRVFRVFRISRVVGLMRAFGSDDLVRELAASRALATFLLTMFLVVLIVEITSIAILYTELGASGANIANAGDAVWWGLVTITTVGYGDEYPVSAGGRVVGAFLLFAGIALFSVLTGFIANLFLSPAGRVRRRRFEPGSTAAQMVEVRRLLDEQDRRTAEIRARLDELERTQVRERAQAR
jgi:voltage-gated potassium channel